jgi:hypothetical protein
VTELLANIDIEASVIGIICIIVLLLFVVAGVRQVMKEKE